MEVENHDDVPVPEEPAEDDDSMTIDYGEIKSSAWTFRGQGGRSTAGSGFASVVTAIQIAKWMAKAYGYSSRKKALYKSQDKV